MLFGTREFYSLGDKLMAARPSCPLEKTVRLKIKMIFDHKDVKLLKDAKTYLKTNNKDGDV